MVTPDTPLTPLRDGLGRAITDLRLSVTDRCNYRCVYCRTGESGALYSELSMELYLRMVRLFVSMGVEKIRFTGGEPLMRRGLTDLIAEVSKLRMARDPEERLDLALTTNGHMLAPMAKDLRAAGLNRLTVSMDAVEPDVFARITRVQDGFQKVRDGIRAAQDAGFERIKVNCVLMRGFNDDQIEGFAEFARTEDVIVRFIEFMPLEEADDNPESSRKWSPDTVVTHDEILARLEKLYSVQPLAPNHLSETARRYIFADNRSEIGIIAPVSRPFCGHCSRIRLTSDGKLRTCLFSQIDHDLAGKLMRGMEDEAARVWIREVVEKKEARHHIGEAGFLKPGRAMVHIGG
ncbi:GTP 3',8-cyclase MoaA [Granulicella cerasi]|uniref:GTP 3',8-cyclase n=1 Tax=Granulicella cerasi TaxID=741063 RepID=A0ABW1ZA15_9BACT